MTAVRVKFFHNEWDNYQGASGKTIEIEKLIEIGDTYCIGEIRDIVISELNFMGYNDNNFEVPKTQFTGRGIISITIEG